MPLTSSRGSKQWRMGIRVVGILLLVLIACGFATDLLFGLPMLFSSRSWTAWVVGTIALGALCLIGEGGGDWISSRDRVDHPLWRRFGTWVCCWGLRSR